MTMATQSVCIEHRDFRMASSIDTSGLPGLRVGEAAARRSHRPGGAQACRWVFVFLRWWVDGKPQKSGGTNLPRSFGWPSLETGQKLASFGKDAKTTPNDLRLKVVPRIWGAG